MAMHIQIEKRNLLPEQAAAAYEIKKHISVTAGPGSGKTTVLVERYLHILRKNPHLNIDQIVAITFTNRAANEMRERLRKQLDLILQSSSDKDRRQWLNYKRTLDGAVITTIHGFCSRLLREFPVEARVDPQFLLLDEHRAAMLLESVVEECLTKFISAGHVEISRLTLGVGRGKLAAALAQIYREVRGQGLSLRELALKTANSHATEADHANAINDLTSSMNDFLSVRRTTPAARGNHAEVSASWPNFRTTVATVPNVEGLADYCRSVESFRKFRPSASGNLKPYVHALDSLIWESNLLGRIPQLSLDLFAKQYALEICLLLTEIDERLNEEKGKISALDFDDLELRALEVLERPEVLTRAAERYKFFLVDEFQDTNGLQRRLLEKLALQKGRRASANLFIVGDPKQSIYSFRGADVAVFSAMTDTLLSAGGEVKPLLLNFRSQPPLIKFFNLLFERLFIPKDEVAKQEREELGYVYHEHSEAKRELRDSGPLVELMVTTEASGSEDDPKADQGSRELDADQLTLRIASLVNREPGAPNYSDIALLFRAMTQVRIYESAFRRANIPYQTVLGRGFYERQEITDLIQLLRFLDNKTDELALAAVLRSPLCGISDNALLALRCAPWLDEVDHGDPLKHFTQTRKFVVALRRHREIAYIDDEEHELLDRARDLIDGLSSRQHHYSLSKLLRFAVDRAEFFTVIAASFDGAQRLANVQRLFTLAERFEHSGAHLIRDFVRYVEEFEAIGSRESEGQIDEAANAVKLMTIHQAKGLEFPVVIIPELQRYSRMPDNWFLLDRHRGLTLKVPDGRGKLVAGCTFSSFEQRQAGREEFESMRLLYVAATRAQDRLILSGTVKDVSKLGLKGDTWLNWIWQSLELPTPSQSTVIDLADDLQAQITLNLADEPSDVATVEATAESPDRQSVESLASIAEAFPLLGSIAAECTNSVHRFSVTQLINYRRCPRQYYFDRVLHAPSPDALAVWNNAEAPEPPANLTATLKGAVIHRFCETYTTGNNAEELLRESFADVVRARQAELADRLVEINVDEAIADLLPLAHNYLGSPVFERIEKARVEISNHSGAVVVVGLWSELGFRLRRRLGILSGAIDKLLITRAPTGNGYEVEIIDFKTNRIRSQKSEVRSERVETNLADSIMQFAFDFDAPVNAGANQSSDTVDDQVRIAASDYELQMQAYALAVTELMPELKQAGFSIKSTLHFLDPNVEFHFSGAQLSSEACALAIDEAMMDIVSSVEPSEFPFRPAMHCRMCNFRGICQPGREWVRADQRANNLVEDRSFTAAID